MISIKKYSEFARYVIIGILVTILNILSYLLFDKIIGIHYIISNVLAWIISVFVTFLLNKKIVFKDDEKSNIIKKLVYFYTLRILSLIIDTIVLTVCLKLNLGDVVSKIIANISTTFNNYFIAKYFIFKKK